MTKKTIEATPIRVGVVDDHPMFAQGCTINLNQIDGVKATLEVNSAEGLMAILGKAKELPHILMMDVKMRPMNGIQATKLVTEQHPSIKIIAFSSDDDDWTLAQMMLAGACAFVKKDFDRARLKEIIYAVHSSGKYHADLFSLYGEGLRRFAEDILSINFSDKEKTYIRLLCQGNNYTQIAAKMELTVDSINYYRGCIAKKLNTNNQAVMILLLIRMKEISVDDEKIW